MLVVLRFFGHPTAWQLWDLNPVFTLVPRTLVGRLRRAARLRLAALRARGNGWQTRINDTLRATLQLAGLLQTGVERR